MPSVRAGSRPPSPTRTTSRGWPSRSAARASRATTGSAHAPPTQPATVPSGRINAFAPGLADVGRSHRTTVARANGSPWRLRSAASVSRSSGTCVLARGLTRERLVLIGGERRRSSPKPPHRLAHGFAPGFPFLLRHALVPQQAPDFGRRDRDVDVTDPEMPKRVDHRVGDGGGGADGGGLAHTLGAEGVMRRGRHGVAGLPLRRLHRG